MYTGAHGATISSYTNRMIQIRLCQHDLPTVFCDMLQVVVDCCGEFKKYGGNILFKDSPVSDYAGNIPDEEQDSASDEDESDDEDSADFDLSVDDDEHVTADAAEVCAYVRRMLPRIHRLNRQFTPEYVQRTIDLLNDGVVNIRSRIRH